MCADDEKVQACPNYADTWDEYWNTGWINHKPNNTIVTVKCVDHFGK